MRVAGITKNGDWTFCRGRASYRTKSDAIAQNVITNLKCLVNDWFLDIEYGIDWYYLLGNKGTQDQIIKSVSSMTLSTFGVRRVLSVEILTIDSNRFATIQLKYIDIFDNEFSQGVPIEVTG